MSVNSGLKVIKFFLGGVHTPGVGVTLRPSHFSLLHFFDAVKNRDEVAVIPNEDSKYLWLIKGHMAKPTKPERILPVEVRGKCAVSVSLSTLSKSLSTNTP